MKQVAGDVIGRFKLDYGLTWMPSITSSSWLAGEVHTLKKYLTATSAVEIAMISAKSGS